MGVLRRLAAALAVMAALPAGAQVAPERKDLLRSDWYARASADALDTGDRAGAILLALRGLPADPTEADFAAYSGAHDALYRAVASRALRLPIRQVSTPYFSPDGARVVTWAWVPDDPERAPNLEPVTLWDTQTGQRIAALLPVEQTHRAGAAQGGVVFSPDGTILAVPTMVGLVHIFDARTGAALRSFRLAGEEPGFENATRIVGFTPDGRQICLGADPSGRYFVLDVNTGAALMATPPVGNVRETGHRWQAFMGSDGACYFTRHYISLDYTHFPRVVLERLTPGGMVDVVELAGPSRPEAMRAVGRFIPNPYLPVALWAQEGTYPTLIDLGTGRLTVLDRLDSDSFFPTFSREGRVIVQSASHFGLRVLRAVDLAGEPVAPELEDEAPFLLRLYDMQGRFREMGFGSPTLEGMTFAPPKGRALYDLVWSHLPEALRAQIGAERVIRSGG